MEPHCRNVIENLAVLVNALALTAVDCLAVGYNRTVTALDYNSFSVKVMNIYILNERVFVRMGGISRKENSVAAVVYLTVNGSEVVNGIKCVPVPPYNNSRSARNRTFGKIIPCSHLEVLHIVKNNIFDRYSAGVFVNGVNPDSAAVVSSYFKIRDGDIIAVEQFKNGIPLTCPEQRSLALAVG